MFIEHRTIGRIRGTDTSPLNHFIGHTPIKIIFAPIFTSIKIIFALTDLHPGFKLFFTLTELHPGFGVAAGESG